MIEEMCFPSITQAALAATPVRDHLRNRNAIVLERVARGGGATNWYHCTDQNSLSAVEQALRPGSVVSFYFDGRIRREANAATTCANLQDLVRDAREWLVGVANADGLHLDMEIISGPGEMAEYLSNVPFGTELFHGPFPGRDNDEFEAITLALPDRDGVARAHPT